MDKMNSFTFFIDNLPFGMSNMWLKQIFKNYGDVNNAYVSMKRTYTDTRFSFLRFLSKNKAESVIRKSNGLIIRGRKTLVKCATYLSDVGK